MKNDVIYYTLWQRKKDLTTDWVMVTASLEPLEPIAHKDCSKRFDAVIEQWQENDECCGRKGVYEYKLTEESEDPWES